MHGLEIAHEIAVTASHRIGRLERGGDGTAGRSPVFQEIAQLVQARPVGLDEVIHHLLDGPLPGDGPRARLRLADAIEQGLHGGEGRAHSLVDLGGREQRPLLMHVLLGLDLLRAQSHEMPPPLLRSARPPALGRALGVQAPALAAREVGVAHGRRERAMSRLLGDEPVHGLADAPVGRMALGRRP